MSYADEATEALHKIARTVYGPVHKAGVSYVEAHKAALGKSDLIEVMQATIGIIVAAEHLKAMAEEAERSARDALAMQMDATGASKVQTTGQTAYLQRKPAFVSIDQEDLLPPEFIRQPPPSPDKKAIKAAIEAGNQVPGCTLVVPNSQTLVIRGRE